MVLSNSGIQDKEKWLGLGYQLPLYNRAAVTKATKEHPYWLHFGAGNIFRAFQARAVENLLNAGEIDRGLIVAEGYDSEIIEKIDIPHDSLNLLATLKANGSITKQVIGSVVESLLLNQEHEKHFARLKEIFTAKSLQIVSFTITEKGYSLGNGATYPEISQDFNSGPTKPQSYIGKICALLYHRYQNGTLPLALVSMDNCTQNGDKLFSAVSTFAEKWAENGLVDAGFLSYVRDRQKLSFPWTMIDKITPRPDQKVEAIFKADGFVHMQPFVTAKNTYIAPFVNAEECEYLVIEDNFPNGRPALEQCGFIFTDKKTVNQVEQMKVGTCLNPLHTALAVFGCLLGYERISEEMKNPHLKKLVEIIGYQEGLPVVVDPKIIHPKAFLDTVITVRLPNPFMPDSPQRIATDTSQKLAARFGETIQSYVASSTLDAKSLKAIPLVFAAWLRYLLGVDDEGRAFTLSPDPMLEELSPIIKQIKLGQTDRDTLEELIKPLLENTHIFGVNLCEIDLASSVLDYLNKMLEGVGAVKRVLAKVVE